ncbi:MAG: glycosyltransferase family 4 protein [Pseudonocardia sp.]
MRVLLDAGVDGADGIGRYSRCVADGLRRGAPPDVELIVRGSGLATHRYSPAAGQELLGHAGEARADLVHLLDYRIPITAAAGPAMIVTVHDVLRVAHPQPCYSDDEFAAHRGDEGLAELRAAVAELRELVAFPVDRRPAGAHEDYLGRMLALAAARAEQVMVPTTTVAAQLCHLVPASEKVMVSPWGLDHLPAPARAPVPGVPDRYVLYVGQARPHKGLAELLAALAVRRTEVVLVLAGRDFTPAGPAGLRAVQTLGADRVVALGEVSDAVLARLYRNASALVHLAEHEGFGFPPLEALAHGCPVLAADIPVLHETLGPHASFVDRDDPDAVAADLAQLILGDAPAARTERITWARRFTWDRHVEDLVGCYRRTEARC